MGISWVCFYLLALNGDFLATYTQGDEIFFTYSGGCCSEEIVFSVETLLCSSNLDLVLFFLKNLVGVSALSAFSFIFLGVKVEFCRYFLGVEATLSLLDN